MIPGDPGDVWSWTSGAAVAAAAVAVPAISIPIPTPTSAGGIAAIGDFLMSFMGLFRLIPDVVKDGFRSEVLVDDGGRIREQARRKAVRLDSFEVIAFSTTALPLSPATYAGATGATLTVESADLRYRIDGQAPTATVGHLVTSGNDLVLTSLDAIQKFQAIRDAATDVDVTITYTKAD